MATEVCLVKAIVFPVVSMYVRDGPYRKLSAKWVILLNCGVREDSWESLGLQGIQTNKGNQFWIFIGRTDAEAGVSIFWPPNVKNWVIRKDPDARKDWRQDEKETTEDGMVGWYHQLDEHEYEQALEVGDIPGNLVCCSPWGCKESNTTEWINWTDFLKSPMYI